MYWIYLIQEFHNLCWITEINELFHDILIYWDPPVYARYFELESWRNIWWCPLRRALMTYGRTEPLDVIWYSTYEMCRAGRAWGLYLGTVNVAYCGNLMLSLVVCLLNACVIRGRGFEQRLQGGGDVRFQCHQAKVSVFWDLLLHL